MDGFCPVITIFEMLLLPFFFLIKEEEEQRWISFFYFYFIFLKVIPTRIAHQEKSEFEEGTLSL